MQVVLNEIGPSGFVSILVEIDQPIRESSFSVFRNIATARFGPGKGMT